MSTDALRKKWGQTGKSASNCDEKALCPELAVIVLDRRRSSCKTLVLSHCVNLRHDTRHRDDDDDWTTKKTLQLGKLVGCLDDHQARERERKKKKKNTRTGRESKRTRLRERLTSDEACRFDERASSPCLRREDFLAAGNASWQTSLQHAGESVVGKPASCLRVFPADKRGNAPTNVPDANALSRHRCCLRVAEAPRALRKNSLSTMITKHLARRS